MAKTFKKARLIAFAAVFLTAAAASFMVFNAPKTAVAAPDVSWYTGNETNTTYLISGADELAGLAQLVNGGKDFAGKTINLTAPIDLSAYSGGAGWTPVGKDAKTPFKGTFNGYFYPITNLKTRRYGANDSDPDRTSRVGLFGYLYDATVNGVYLTGVDIEGYDYVGAVTGDMYKSGGTCAITGCAVTGVVKGRQRVGGIVGFMQNGTSVTECDFDGTVGAAGGSSAAADYIGGIVGYYFGSNLSQCCSAGSVSGRDRVGGIAGYCSSFSASANTVLQDCYSAANVSGRDYAGGIAGSINLGQNNAPLTNATFVLQRAYSTGEVTGKNNVGGIAGWVRGAVQNCAALNHGITAETAAGRIAGTFNAGALENNLAFSGMTAAGFAFDEGLNVRNGLGGADIDATEIKNDGTIGGLFAASPWSCAGGRLPRFGYTAEMPLYLRPIDIDFWMFESITETFVYDGTEHKPAVVLSAAGAAAFPKVTFTVAYDNNTNAGTDTAEVIITGTGNYGDTVTLYFTIGQAGPTGYTVPVIAPRTYVYGQTLSGNVPIYMYSGWAWEAPATLLGDAGTKYFWAVYTPSDSNYHAVKQQIEIVINKIAVKDAPSPAINDTTWTGGTLTGVSNYPATTAVINGSTQMIFTLTDGDYQGIGCGPYAAVFSLTDPDNYMWADGTTDDRIVNWSITKATMTDGAAVVVKSGFEYDGTSGTDAFVNIVTGDWEHKAVQYYVNGAWVYGAPVNAGQYKVRAFLTGSPGPNFEYADFVTAEVSYEITRKYIAAGMFDDIASFEYNGAAQTPDVYSFELAAGKDYTLSAGLNSKSAGAASVTVTGAGNYQGTISLSFTITPKTVIITPGAGQGKAYGAGEGALAYAADGLIAGDVLSGALSREGGENAGAYKILLGTLANADYEIIFTQNILFTIAKGLQDAPKLIFVSHTETSITVKAVEGAMYSIDGETWLASNVFEGLDAGKEYTIYMRMDGTDNLEMSDAASAHFSTAAVPQSNPVTPPDKNGNLWIWFLVGLVLGTLLILWIWFGLIDKKDGDGDGKDKKQNEQVQEGGK